MPILRTTAFAWPPKDLNPNARNHWSVRSKLAKSYRWACFIQAKKAIDQGWADVHEYKRRVKAGQRLALTIDFYPPDRRHRDDDNVIASFKAGRDGIADALGIDDRHFVSQVTFRRDEPIPNGLVMVSLAPVNGEDGQKNARRHRCG